MKMRWYPQHACRRCESAGLEFHVIRTRRDGLWAIWEVGAWFCPACEHVERHATSRAVPWWLRALIQLWHLVRYRACVKTAL